MTNKEAVENFLKEKKIKSGGNNGSYLTEIKLALNLSFPETRKSLNELWTDNKIIIREGFHGQLIFLK